jgi:hypothetical protein
MNKKPNELEIMAGEMVEVFSENTTLKELTKKIKEYTLIMGTKLSMMVTIERKEKEYHSTIYINKKDLKRKYSGTKK